MRTEAQLANTSELSYLEASKVSSPAGALSELDVLSAEGQRLGRNRGRSHRRRRSPCALPLRPILRLVTW